MRAVRALERGYRGFVGYVGHELVGYYWWVDGAIEPRHSDIVNLGLDIELGPGEVYGYDFFLLEEHRGDGKSMEFLAKIETALRAHGYRILWGYVVADNRPRALDVRPARVRVGAQGGLPHGARQAHRAAGSARLKH